MVDLAPLRRAKLRALVGPSPEELTGEGNLPGSAWLRTASRAWVLVDDGNVAGFGAALAWASRSGVPFESLTVLVAASASSAGVAARRASCFASPPAVSYVSDRSLVPPPAAPGLDADVALPPAEVLDGFARLLSEHGADPIVEHGVLRGEVLGLEVARVVSSASAWVLSVGVGRHDREARVELRPGQPVGDALDEVVALVRHWRRPGDLRHPANTLARERWLRSLLVASPSVVGASSLAPLPSALPLDDLRLPAPAPALGLSTTGTPLLVVCSVGVDLDLVPTAADLRLLHAPDADLVLVLPEGDDLPVTRSLAASLARLATVVTVGRDWIASLTA